MRRNIRTLERHKQINTWWKQRYSGIGNSSLVSINSVVVGFYHTRVFDWATAALPVAVVRTNATTTVGEWFLWIHVQSRWLMKPVSNVSFWCWVLFEKKTTFLDTNSVNMSYDFHKDVNFKQSCMLKSYYEPTKYITWDGLSISDISCRKWFWWSMTTHTTHLSEKYTSCKSSVKSNTHARLDM